MPYFKFASEEDREKAWNIELKLAKENGGKPQGLVAAINDSNYHLVNFYSTMPYLKAFDRERIQYQIISRENISSPLADFLRRNHPEYVEEL